MKRAQTLVLTAAMAVLLGGLVPAVAEAAASVEARVSGNQVGSVAYSQAQFATGTLQLAGGSGPAGPLQTHSSSSVSQGAVKLEGLSAFAGLASATGGFYDDVTLTAPGTPNGTVGSVTFSVQVDAVLNISNSHSAAGWDVKAHLGPGTDWDIEQAAVVCGVNISCGTGSAQPGSFSATVDFVFGQPLRLVVRAVANASTVANFSNETLSVATFDLGQSIYWGGIQAVSAAGTPLAGFNLVSASGTDWRQSFVPSPVPEPASLLLLLAGLAVLAAQRVARRRTHSM